MQAMTQATGGSIFIVTEGFSNEKGPQAVDEFKIMPQIGEIFLRKERMKQMEDSRYDKLARMRADIQRDKDKIVKLQEGIKVKEAKLKEAEGNQIVADVGAMKLSPEQLGQVLELVKNGGLEAILNGSVEAVAGIGQSPKDEEPDDERELENDNLRENMEDDIDE